MKAENPALDEQFSAFLVENRPSGRPCTEQIFILHAIIKPSFEYQRRLSIDFVLTKLIAAASAQRMATRFSSPLRLVWGILFPFLFLLAIDFVMRTAMDRDGFGIPWQPSTYLDFADDLGLLADIQKNVKTMTSSLAQEATKAGLQISGNKPKVMRIGYVAAQDPIIMGQHPLEEVNEFTYMAASLQATKILITIMNNMAEGFHWSFMCLRYCMRWRWSSRS